MYECDVVVIGGGPAGIAAALSAEACGAKKTALIERGGKLGGILNQCLHSGFGIGRFGAELRGTEYAEFLRGKIAGSKVEVFLDTAVIRLGSDGTMLLSGAYNGKMKAGATVLASGCRETPAGALPIAGSRPAGIFTAGAVQKFINVLGYDIGERILVLGSGDVGMIVAERLVQLGKEVIAVIEQNNRCGGLERNRLRCLQANDIPLLTGCTITRILGEGRISGAEAVEIKSGREWVIPCDTLVISVGLVPERELAEEACEGGVIPPWLFICGNAEHVHQIVDSAEAQAEEIGRKAAAYAAAEHRKRC